MRTLGIFLIVAGCGGWTFADSVAPHDGGAKAPAAKPLELPENPFASSHGLGCSAMFEGFCDNLYTQQNKGNVDLTVGNEKVPLRWGSTDNQFGYAFYLYERAKLAAKDNLPDDFKSKLEAEHYFDKLGAVLDSKPKKFLTRAEGTKRTRELSELSLIWNEAFESTKLARVLKKYPDFESKEVHSLDELRFETTTGNELQAEINRKTWEKNPWWLGNVADFKQIQDAYYDVLQTLPIDDDIKHDWLDRIRSVKFVIPQSDPQNLDDPECASTTVNAYYSSLFHTFTVCGGAMVTNKVLFWMAHELGHSLDLNRSTILFKWKTKVWNKLWDLQKKVCEEAPIQSCPAEWTGLKHELASLLKEYGDFKPQLPELLSCLQYQKGKLKKLPKDDVYRTWGAEDAGYVGGSYADNNTFLTLISPEVPKTDHSLEKNPNYLNPCGKDKPKKNTFFAEDAIPLIFTLEYVCSDSSKASSADRLFAAGQVAELIESAILAKVTPIGGKFSSNSHLASSHMAEDPTERFADFIGTQVLAKRLEKLSSVSDRRNLFFASTSLFCDPLSLQKMHPDEAQAQKKLSIEPHSTAKGRRLEMLTEPIRKALDCDKDFEREDCHL